MLDHLFKTNKMTMLFLHNVSRTISWWASVLSVHYNRSGFFFCICQHEGFLFYQNIQWHKCYFKESAILVVEDQFGNVQCDLRWLQSKSGLTKRLQKAWNRMPKLRPTACLPTRSLWGPLLTEFQFQETFDLQFVQPSWCLLVKTTYLSKMKIIIKVRHYFFRPSC